MNQNNTDEAREVEQALISGTRQTINATYQGFRTLHTHTQNMSRPQTHIYNDSADKSTGNVLDSESRDESAQGIGAIDPEEQAAHETNADEAHHYAHAQWDSPEARQTRAAYYDAHFDPETATAAKITDRSLGVHPKIAATSTPKNIQKPARKPDLGKQTSVEISR